MDVRDNKLYIGGIEAKSLVEDFGSPLYVYDEIIMRTRARELIQAVTYPNTEIKYACKANTNVEIMKVLRDEGVSIDAVSPGELYAALRAGFDKEGILFDQRGFPFAASFRRRTPPRYCAVRSYQSACHCGTPRSCDNGRS